MSRRAQVVILVAAVVAFAGMLTLVVLGIRTSRRNRDFLFGLERADMLIREERYDEAADSLVWLTERAGDANKCLSVLRRGVDILDATADHTALRAGARTSLERFPGNNSIRAVAVYAAVLAGESDEALRMSRDGVDETYPSIFAWVLLENNEAPPTPGDPYRETDNPLFLASIGNDAQAEDLERAWRLTRDWRYAMDAVVVHMRDGRLSHALETVVGASLALYAPLAAADVHTDTGDPTAALLALSNASDPDAPDVALRKADALMRLSGHREARSLYDSVAQTGEPAGTRALTVALINLAWLADSREVALDYYDRAVQSDSSSWTAVEQRALTLAAVDLEAAYRSVSDYTGPAREDHEALLLLRLTPVRDERSFEAEIWRLLEGEGTDAEAFRFAAWYFLGRGQTAALEEVLGRVNDDSAWVLTYRAIISATEHRWDEAVRLLETAHSAAPSWSSALNLGLAHIAYGDEASGSSLIDEAVDRVTDRDFPQESAQVFLALARVTEDRRDAYDAVLRALELDPGNTEALLLRARLESSPAY